MNRMKAIPMIFALHFFVCILVLVAQQENKDPITELEGKAAKYSNEGNMLELARCQTKLGYLYKDRNNLPKAIEYFQKAIVSNESLGNLNAIKNLCANIAMVYSEGDNPEQALIFFKRSLTINEKLGKRKDIMADLINIAQVQQTLKKYPESIQNLERASGIAQEYSDFGSLLSCYSLLSDSYEKNGNTIKSKEYFELAASVKSHLQKQEIKKFESLTEQAEAEVSVKNTEIKSKQEQINQINREKQLTLQLLKQQKEYAQLKEQEFKSKEKLQQIRQRNIYYIALLLSAILLLVVISLVFIFKQLKEKKKAYNLLESSNKQIIEQKREIEVQHEVLTTQKKKITDSILYAKRIQKAVIPPESILDNVLPENFIVYRPRDIVSGDFYWLAEKESIVIVAAVDCTGHGVPGAFMSMLGVAFLNDIVNKTTFNRHIRSLQANEILNQLREHVIISLHQSGKVDEPKDGMDMALLIIDLENKKMQFAGAHNPVYIIRNGEEIMLNGDKMSIGILRDAEQSFSNNEIDLQPNDLIYIFSDGYYDQFGGPNGRKMLSANFRSQLLQNYQKPMEEQKQLLEEYYDKWKGKHDQIDDVMVVGIKFSPVVAKLPQKSVYNWRNKQILIAEDTEINYLFLVEALKHTQVKINRVLNGEDAVLFCQNNNPSLVLMDINMPIMDGIEATKRIRSFNKQLPIIAQTALVQKDDFVAIKEAGCNDYILKPINLNTFLSIINNYLIK